MLFKIFLELKGTRKKSIQYKPAILETETKAYKGQVICPMKGDVPGLESSSAPACCTIHLVGAHPGGQHACHL